MAVSPMIPTSFVPRQPDASLRARRSGANLFLIISLVLLAVALVASGGVFAYQKYLESVATAKAAKLADAEKRINEGTVEGFVRLRDRLSASEGLLNNHIALSTFMSTLENSTLSTVSFDGLQVQVADDRTATVLMTGTAKSFNSLAAQSAAFANVPSIEHALFSDFKVDKGGAVDFTLAFDIDSSLVAGRAAAKTAQIVVPAATSTSAIIPPPGAVATTTVKTGATTPPPATTPPANTAQTATPPAAPSTVPTTPAPPTN